jgi:MSHA biogenesis protein MshQ
LSAGLLCLLATAAQAASYTFPGSMPAGCSGSSGTYTCGSVTLASGDTVTIGTPKPASISFTALSTNNAKINASGSASDLTLTVSGTMTVSAGAVINANVVGGNIASSGAVTYGGSITTSSTGYISLGAGTTVAGALTTVSGAITLLTGTSSNYTTVGSILSGGTVTLNSYNSVTGATVGYLISAAGHNSFGDSITSTTTYVSLGGYATVHGSIYSQTYVDTGSYSNVTGSITSATSYIDTGHDTTIGGSLAALGTYVDIHFNTSVGGSIKAQSYVNIVDNDVVGGNVTAQTTVYVGSGSSVAKCVRSNGSSSILLHSAASVSGACCGSGSTCTNTCVTATPKPAACAYPDSALVAEYRFEETSYSGTDGEVADSSGNGHNGRMTGDATSTPDGKICRGVLVGKNLDSSIAAFNTGIDVNAIGNAGTITFWYKSVTSGLEHRMLFDATTASTGNFYLYRDDQGSGVDLNFHLTDGGGTDRNVDKLNTITDATWSHIAITWYAATGTLASRLTLFVNGVQQDQQKYTISSGAIASAINTLFFGDNRSSSSVEVNSANGYIDQVKLYDAELTASEVAAVAAETQTCSSAPHHIEVTSGSATGVTCVPNTFTIKACADAACSTPYNGAVSGNLVLSGAPTVVYTPAFSIPAGSATGTTTVSAHVTTAGTVTASLSGLSVTPSAGTSPYCGMGVSAASGNSCVYTAAASGLIFDVPNHRAESAQTVTVSAVRSSDGGTVCTPAFASVDKTVRFTCSYGNPTSGSVPVRVADGTYLSYGALNAGNSTAAACDATGRDVTLAFNASGVATAKVLYADVGQVGLTAAYTGSGSDAGLSMSGSDSFIAAPSSFAISSVTSAPIVAGSSFDATVTARNSAGAATPNFGKETSPEAVSVSFAKYRPTFSGASSGSFSGSLGSFSSGAATGAGPNKFIWSEVGVGDLTVALSNASGYQGTGYAVSGTTGSSGAVGPFIPSYFDVSTSPACGTFTYSGQPFGTASTPTTITARNAGGGTTVNYDGSNATASLNYAKAVTLSDASGAIAGSWNGTDAVAASAFVQGVASLTTPAFTFTNKLTVPMTLPVRATESSGGNGVTSSGHSEGSVPLRSGRLRLSNAFGSEKASLQMPAQTQYWSANGWVLNNADSCTTVAAGAIVRTNYLDNKGASTSAWTTTPSSITVAGGRGTLTLSAPSPTATGTVDIAVNLGSSSTDQSCLSSHPASTGAGASWLRARNGSTNGCAGVTTYDRDPSARASFGIYSPESVKMIHLRDLY